MSPTIDRADVRFDWFSISVKRTKIVRLTHIPTGTQAKGRGRTLNEAQNNGLVKLTRRLNAVIEGAK